ncbi:AraC family transcriptional regulator [Mycolicibacterium moriokaense]|nr:AraC family transcriptional regulator [Mycolicibacterium moriokaense]
MRPLPPARYLQRAKDFVDSHYADPITVADLAAAAGLSRAHFSRMFTRTFGESPRSYLQTRRLERAAALLRYTDRSVADVCVMVGLQSIGSFTTSFTRVYGRSPVAYRAAMPPAVMTARVPSCVLARDTRRVARTRGGQTHPAREADKTYPAREEDKTYPAREADKTLPIAASRTAHGKKTDAGRRP